jgi:DNA invertase Pin-like site-specific DNA recombinase
MAMTLGSESGAEPRGDMARPVVLGAGSAGSAGKVLAHHVERRAYVYVRQSTVKQVQQHRESQTNQYALVERAVGLGWPLTRVQVIDADLGQSGQDGQRAGFQELVAEVSLGHAGIVLAYEASRLARNNADWYRLLDLAAVVGTLIADADGVYDPQSYNDRLLLGLRGMLSEAELHLLRLRLDAGRLRQVERGTYRQRLPTGLVRLPDGRVAKDPDQQVQHAIALVFARFATLGICQKVVRALRDDGVVLPRRQSAGLHAGQLVWKKPSEAAVYDILRNPAYAGAFVYGRHAPHPDRRPGQRTRVVNVPMTDWTAIHHAVYPAYISWEAFMANQARLADNASRYAARTRGAPRPGSALLVGLVVCGRCGRQMRVTYKPQTRYFCNALHKAYAEPSCQHLDGASVEAAVVEAFFQALAPAELALLEEVLAAQRADHARLVQQHADQVTRAAYDARLAHRRYQAVDPDNRLVAAELERQWELALRAVAEAREAQARFAQQPATPPLDPTLRAHLEDVSRHLPALWTSGALSAAHKKTLLRALVRRVILTRTRPDTVEVKVVWVSGALSVATVEPPIHRATDRHDHTTLVDRILALGAEGHLDSEIARRLTAEGFRSARATSVPKALVGKIRRAHGQTAIFEQFRRQDHIDGQWTVWGLARHLGVTRNWLYDRIRQGTLPATRHPATGHHLIADEPALLDQLRAQVPAHRRRYRPPASSSAAAPVVPALSEAPGCVS